MFKKSTGFLVALLAVIVMASSASAAGDAKALFEAKCSTCHSPKAVEKKEAYSKFTVERWSQCIDNMIKAGLKITDAEKATISKYLGTEYFAK